MDQPLDFLFSPQFARMAAILTLLCLIVAAIAIIGAFLHYGRAREGAGPDRSTPWVLIMATWRDSFIVTLLFVGQALLYRAVDAAGLATLQADSPLHFIPAFAPFFDFLLLIAVFAVCYLRIVAISTWLKKPSE